MNYLEKTVQDAFIASLRRLPRSTSDLVKAATMPDIHDLQLSTKAVQDLLVMREGYQIVLESRRINLGVALWSHLPNPVVCPKCLKILAEIQP